MTLDDFLFAVLPLLVLAALIAHDVRKRMRRRRAARRAAHARWLRETPFSVRAGLKPEEMVHMSASEIDQFMQPADMSEVRREIEEMEKTNEGDELRRASQFRGQRLRIAPPPPRHVADRPKDEELSEEEREILAMTDARAAHR